MNKNKRYLVISLIFTSILISGCSATSTDGFFYNTFVKNMDMFLAKLYTFTGNWGISIIIITLIVRGAVVPFMLKNYKRQKNMSMNMEKAKPELEEIQKKIKELQTEEARAITKEKKAEYRTLQIENQREMFAIYKKYDCNPLSLGSFAPILFQAPFVTALYYTLYNPIYSKDILNAKFLNIPLGEKSYIILILIFIIYYIAGKLSLTLTTKNQNQIMANDNPINTEFMGKITVWISPIMLIFITYSNVAAIGLYFTISGIIFTIQVILGKKLYPPHKVIIKNEKKIQTGTLITNKSKKKKKKK